MLINSYSKESTKQLYTYSKTLAVIGFNTPITAQYKNTVPSGMEIVNTSNYIHELWQVQDLSLDIQNDRSIKKGTSDSYRWVESDDFLFTSISLNKEECQDILSSTHYAYTQLLSFIKKTKYPHLLRFWNYIPSINKGQGDNENYKLFCTGRLKAFNDLHIEADDFPAATAVGHRTHGMTIYTISSRLKGCHHTNKKQQNAYYYPRKYGISSPSFARATSVESPHGNMLFISGTASIIGHKTMHQGNLTAQLKTTTNNIMHLLHNIGYQPESIKTMKIYLRHASFVSETQKILDKNFPKTLKLMTIADICRSDLLVEVECFCTQTIT